MFDKQTDKNVIVRLELSTERKVLTEELGWVFQPNSIKFNFWGLPRRSFRTPRNDVKRKELIGVMLRLCRNISLQKFLRKFFAKAQNDEKVHSLFTIYNSPHSAFTLAEVLITLGIIGIVAALTIPTLISNYEKQAIVAKVQKYNSVFSNVIARYMADNGCLGNLLNCGDGFSSTNADATAGSTKLWTDLKPYFNLIEDCGTDTGCLYTGTYKGLNPNVDTSWAKYGQSSSGGARAILADGSSIYIGSLINNCTTDRSRKDSGPLYEICGEFLVDINGAKSPNIIGKDLFDWYITKAGAVLPIGNADDSNYTNLAGDSLCSATATAIDGGYGFGCTAKIIQEGKITYY